MTSDGTGLRSRAWSESFDAVLQELAVDPTGGLKPREVDLRRGRWGRNALQLSGQRSVVSIFLDQFKSIVILLLAAAAILAMLFSEIAEGVAIFAVILINSAIGFFTEWRAIRSMEALRRFATIDCVVLRDGVVARLPAEMLVPGDIVLLEAGDLVPADLRLIQVAKLTADESTLTGESLPVHKNTNTLTADTTVLDRQNMAFKGTAITRGAGRGVVVATGMSTEIGRIFEQVSEAEAHQTPLEKRLNVLGERLAWAVIIVAAFVAGAGIVAGRELFLAIEVAIALAVAAIPEGLPIVATIALARGMWRMAQRNALVTRLSAVETLGATSVILTDKTGTLTENRMAATAILLDGVDIAVEGAQSPCAAQFRADGDDLPDETAARIDELFLIAVLCNNASLQKRPGAGSQGVGDPTELALLTAASGRDLWRDELLPLNPEVREDPFDPDSKRMATVHQHGDEFLVAVKGAPEAIIPRCSSAISGSGKSRLDTVAQQRWLSRVEVLGARGLRMMAIARKQMPTIVGDPYEALELIGIVGLEDPPRKGVDEALERCRDAGVTVVMVTGDHAATARNVAEAIGVVSASANEDRFVDGQQVDDMFAAGQTQELLAARVFSRVTPEQKLRLIDLYQQHDNVVAMTGDGVNDAPALKKADIGVAMGIRGTAVAKEAAEMVLQDDDFATIVSAVAHGRVIFENIRKFVVYLASCNISEVLVVSLAILAGAPLPLLPLQILFLNLVTDVFPALALGVGPGSQALMKNRPRAADERILTRSHWVRIGLHGTIMALTVLAAMAISEYYLDFDRQHAVTVAFCTLALSQMWHVFNMRDNIGDIFNNEITRNPWIWVALAICLVLVAGAVYAPVLQDVLVLTGPGVQGWTVILSASLVPLLVAPLVRRVVRSGANKGVNQ